jgi:hypothetical protein
MAFFAIAEYVFMLRTDTLERKISLTLDFSKYLRYYNAHCTTNHTCYTRSKQHKGCLRYAVAQLVETLSYKPEDRGFHSRWNHWIASLT